MNSFENAPWGFAVVTPTAMMTGMQQPSGQGHQEPRAIPPKVWPTEDRGSFTHAVCGSCAWVGPGRRSRAGAADDAGLHALQDCANQEPIASPKVPDVASGREHLTARGRS